jgi:VWFA-related protein
MTGILAIAIVAAGAFAVTGVQLRAQEQQPAAAFAEEIEVRSLAIEAVVMNRDGQRIEGLDKDDFRLLVDGEEVAMEHFAEVRGGDYVQTVEAYPGVVAGAPSPTSFLVFVDDFFVIPTDRDAVLRAVLERVPNLGPNDQVAITAWDGNELAALTPWSSSKTEVAAALEEAMNRPAHGLRRQSERRQFDVTLDSQGMYGTSRDPSADHFRLGTQERQYADLLVSQLQGVVGAASASLRAFPTPPGRKVMLLMSGGWPMEVSQWIARNPTRAVNERNIPSGVELYAPIITTANLLGYTVYGVDLPGMMGRSGADASRATSYGTGAMSFTEFYLEGELHNSLQYISVETGGLPFINGQRIGALSEAGADVNNFYWLTFAPSWARDDEFHDIRVELIDPELTVRTRAGYLDISPQSQVGMAVRSSLLYGPFGESDDLKVEVSEVEKVKGKKVDATVKVAIPMSLITMSRTEDGYAGQALLFIAALDPSGGRSDIPAIPIGILGKELPQPGDTVTYEATLRLHRKTSRLTVAVLDPVKGETLVTTITKD